MGGLARRAAPRPRQRATGRERGVLRRVRHESHAGPARGSRPGQPIHGRARDPRVGRRHPVASRLDGLRVPDNRARPRGRHRAERPLARRGSAPRRRLGLQRGRRPTRGGAGDRARHASGKRRARHALRRRAARAATGGAGIAAGAPADLVTIGTDSPRLAGAPSDLVASIVFSASAADVTDVMVAGRDVVCDRAHVSIDVVSELDDAVRHASGRAMTLVIDDIGLLVTCDPTRGEGPLGLVRDAAVIVEDGRVLSIEKAGARCRHSDQRRGSMRDAGLRRQPHASRLRGRSQRRVRGADGGNAVLRRRDHDHCRGDTGCLDGGPRLARGLAAVRGARLGNDARRGQVRLRARCRARAAALPDRRGAHRRRHVPRRPHRPRRVRRARRRVRRPGVRGDADGLRALRTLDRRLLRGRRVRRRTNPGPCSTPAALQGSGCAYMPTSSASGRACSSRSKRARHRRTTAPTSATTISRRSRRATRWRPFSPRATSRLASPIPTRGESSTRARRWRSRATATRGRATRARWRSASRSLCATCT